MDRLGRRHFLAATGAGLAGALAGCGGAAPATDGDATDGNATDGNATDDDSTASATDASATTTSGGDPVDTVGLETLVDGLDSPLAVAFAPEVDRRYVLERPGRVRVHGADGLRDEPLLDLRESVVTGGERGLLGLALHPAFAENRRLYVRYSAPRRPGTPSDYSHTFVLSEFTAGGDGLRADPDTERTLLEVPQPQANHNAGDLAFGPEGYLYVPVGDGGGGGDRGQGHADDWYGAVEGGNGQDVTENRLGSVLRIDVDGRDGDRPYAVPDDNPLVGREGFDEQYAWGFRNPWRCSFDGGDLFVGDVGQNRYEEVDLVERGGNYGWNVREGRHCYGADDCPERTPDDVRGGERLREPILEYPHSGEPVSGVSVIGGVVYRGDGVPGLDGTYLFGDYAASGRLFAATRPDDGGRWPVRVVDAGGLDRLLSFGRDADGEAYVLGDGGLHRVVPAD